MVGEKGGISQSTKRVPGDLCVIAVYKIGLYAPCPSFSNFLKNTLVLQYVLMIVLVEGINNLVYMEQVELYLLLFQLF